MTALSEDTRKAKVVAALIRAGYEVDRLANVIWPQEPMDLTEAWFVEKDGASTWAYLKAWGSGYKVVPDP